MISPRACDDVAECQLRVTSAPVYRLSTCDIVYTLYDNQTTAHYRYENVCMDDGDVHESLFQHNTISIFIVRYIINILVMRKAAIDGRMSPH